MIFCCIQTISSWFDIELVSLPAVTFSSVLLSKILSVRAFVQVVSLVAIVILGAREFEYFVTEVSCLIICFIMKQINIKFSYYGNVFTLRSKFVKNKL